MELYPSRDAVPRDFGPSAVTVGKFDGLHLGHRDVLRQLCDAAQARGLVPAVVTFDRNPLAVLRPDRAPEPLVSPAQKVELFEAAGVGAVLMLPFTEELARLSPEAFVTRILVDTLHAELVLAGRDFRFGDRGSGDLEALKGFGSALGFEVQMIEDYGRGGRRVSSTWIRELLSEGKISAAAQLLGRLPAVRSRVVHGEQRGRELGYPTANLDPDIEGMLPLDGVYAAWATVDGERFGAAVSIGNNPTFEGVPQHQVEAHLLDQRLDLYGRTINLEFVEYIRPMKRFDGVDALVAQLQADERRIREVLVAAAS
ncbi:MAG TPA: bifunctional riboflavin kinase/FAD synthetase [Pseudolysinimonas sp.]|jgi:riboflavin kinase/FMN adenylyltransferase|nr:bifunctional riboflavin kinase/FAD synthetase [Pseudolysinimonas sp.]